jgi:E3 ubiquitin-protein ligase Arkadia
LPEDVFSKCLVETRCHSSDKAQEETSCAICLVSNSCINGD